MSGCNLHTKIEIQWNIIGMQIITTFMSYIFTLSEHIYLQFTCKNLLLNVLSMRKNMII